VIDTMIQNLHSVPIYFVWVHLLAMQRVRQYSRIFDNLICLRTNKFSNWL